MDATQNFSSPSRDQSKDSTLAEQPPQPQQPLKRFVLIISLRDDQAAQKKDSGLPMKAAIGIELQEDILVASLKIAGGGTSLPELTGSRPASEISWDAHHEWLPKEHYNACWSIADKKAYTPLLSTADLYTDSALILNKAALGRYMSPEQEAICDIMVFNRASPCTVKFRRLDSDTAKQEAPCLLDVPEDQWGLWAGFSAEERAAIAKDGWATFVDNQMGGLSSSVSLGGNVDDESLDTGPRRSRRVAKTRK